MRPFLCPPRRLKHLSNFPSSKSIPPSFKTPITNNLPPIYSRLGNLRRRRLRRLRAARRIPPRPPDGTARHHPSTDTEAYLLGLGDRLLSSQLDHHVRRQGPVGHRHQYPAARHPLRTGPWRGATVHGGGAAKDADGPGPAGHVAGRCRRRGKAGFVSGLRCFLSSLEFFLPVLFFFFWLLNCAVGWEMDMAAMWLGQRA